MSLQTTTESNSVWRDSVVALTGAFRVPVRSGHVALLDGWRGLCIILVIAGHAVPGMGRLGSIGVEFFFVLSGRLMADILIFKRQEIGIFLVRRFARVVPALAVYVLVVGLLINLPLLASGLPLRIESPAAALFFFHNYIPATAVTGPFEHTWSLAVEEHGYLLLVLLALITTRGRRASAAIALALCAAALAHALWLAAHALPGAQPIIWRSDVRVASILLSFAMYVILRSAAERGEPPRIGWLAPAAALLAIAGIFWIDPDRPEELAVCTILAALAINTLETAAPRVKAVVQHPAMLWCGTLSFSLYLWQQVCFQLTHFGLVAPAALLLSVGCALWSFHRVEDPARNYLNARFGRSHPRIGDHVVPGKKSGRHSEAAESVLGSGSSRR